MAVSGDQVDEQAALKAELDDLMRRRIGETAQDAVARAVCASWFGLSSWLKIRRRRLRRVKAHLDNLGIEQSRQVELLRSSLEPRFSWLAAEVVYKHPDGESFLAELEARMAEPDDD